MKKTSIIVLALLLALTTLLAGCASPASTPTQAPATGTATPAPTDAESSSSKPIDPVTVKIGVVGENNEQWKVIAKNLESEGIIIELVVFSDYALPNRALADKSLDLNAFQHHAFLNSAIRDTGFELTAIADTIIAPLGLYSKKHTALDQIPEKGKIAIPSDATNGGRALKLLEAAGLIKVDPAAGYTPTLLDITENAKNLEIIEVEAAQTPRLLDDVAFSVINGGHAVDAGFVPAEDAIFIEAVAEGSDNPYINIIVARTEDKDNAIYKRIVEAYHTDEVAQVIQETYKGSYIPTWK